MNPPRRTPQSFLLLLATAAMLPFHGHAENRMEPNSTLRRRRLEKKLVYVGNGGSGYGECEGDCDADDDCLGDLVCFQSNGAGDSVPGCSGLTGSGKDFCFMPTVHTGNPVINHVGDGLSEYGECEGDCDGDEDCLGSLVCFQRNGDTRVTNCDGTGFPYSDYCYDPNRVQGSFPPSTSAPMLFPTPSSSSTPSPTPAPASPSSAPVANDVNNRGHENPDSYSYEHVVERVDSSANCAPPTDALPVIVAVTSREVIVGCHSFHEYLSPNYRTVFVLNQEAAQRWYIDDLVQNAGCDDSLGATALLLDNYGGEVLGKNLAMHYSLNELGPDIEFLHQVNCDVHPIPKKHKFYLSMEEIVTRMVNSFVIARAQREPEKYSDVKDVPDIQLVTNLREGDPYLKLPILGMNQLLFEEFPSMNNLRKTYLHGHNICDWDDVYARPGRLEQHPWLCDSSEWVENHMMMFDIEKLLLVEKELLVAPALGDVDSYPSSTRLTSRVAHDHGMTVLLNQDVYAHQNFARRANFEEQSLPDVPNWLRVLSLETLASTRSPEMNHRAWNAYRDYAGYDVRIGNTAMGFMIRETQGGNSPWFAFDDGEDLDEDSIHRIVAAMLKICGYELLSEETEDFVYAMKGAYPALLYVDATKGSSSDVEEDSWEIVQLRDQRGRLHRYTAVASVATEAMREMMPEERIVRVPKEAALRRIPDSPQERSLTELNQRGQFSKKGRGECYAEDHKEKNHCGYSLSPEFKYPYVIG